MCQKVSNFLSERNDFWKIILCFLNQMTQSYAGGLEQLNSLDRILVCQPSTVLSFVFCLLSFVFCLLSFVLSFVPSFLPLLSLAVDLGAAEDGAVRGAHWVGAEEQVPGSTVCQTFACTWFSNLTLSRRTNIWFTCFVKLLPGPGFSNLTFSSHQICDSVGQEIFFMREENSCCTRLADQL